MILRIDMTGTDPIYRQIRDQIVLGVAKGALRPGDSLPTVRQLAEDLGVNPMTVSKAYTLLREDEIIVIDRRHGAKIKDGAAPEGSLFSPGFDNRARLLVTEALLRGASRGDIKAHLSNLVDGVPE